MFKKRFRKWGLDNKNIRRKEAHQVIRLKRQRESAGKHAHRIIVRGRTYEWADIERHLRRNPRLQAKVDVASGWLELGSSGNDVIVRTPSPDPAVALSVPPLSHADDNLRTTEEIGRLLRDWVCGRLEARFWVVEGGNIHNPAYKGGRCQRWAHGLSRIVALIDSGEFTVGFRLLNQWLDHSRRIFGHEDFSLLKYGPRIIYEDLPQMKDKKLSRIISKHLVDLAETALGGRHPGSLALARLHGASTTRLPFLNSCRTKPVLDLLQGILGEKSQMLWDLRQEFEFWHVDDNEKWEQLLRSLLAVCPPELEQKQFDMQIDLAMVIATPARAHEADEILRSVSMSRYSRSSGHIFKRTELLVYGYSQRYSDADEAYRESLAFTETSFGPSHRYSLNLMDIYHNILQATGRNEEAAQLMAEIGRRMEIQDLARD